MDTVRLEEDSSKSIDRILVLGKGSLEVKPPTIRTDGKAELGRVRKEKRRSEKIKEEKEREERRCRCAKRKETRDSLCFCFQ